MKTLSEFVRRLAAGILPHGYWFYVLGEIPEGKDAAGVDRKLVERYGAACPRWERARRKRAGHANVRYLRCGRQFILAATHGRHRFFEDERACIRDARRESIKLGNYSIRARAGHSHVRLEERFYRQLRAYFLELALRRSADVLADELRALPLEPYVPVGRQMGSILRVVNRARHAAGLPLVESGLALRRRSRNHASARAEIARTRDSSLQTLVRFRAGGPCDQTLRQERFDNT